MKVKLTQKFIDRDLLCPEGKKQIEFCDTELPGFYILTSSVSPGKGSYYLRYKNDAGKTCHRKISKTETLNLKLARDRAKELKLEIAQGRDPQAEIKQKRNEMTYGEFMEEYFFPYIEPRRRSAGSYHQMFDTWLQPIFGDTKVNQITKRQVQVFHDNLRSQRMA